jgi:hypothetical protein
MQNFRTNGTVPADTPRPRQYDNTEMYNRRAWNDSPGLAQGNYGEFLRKRS